MRLVRHALLAVAAAFLITATSGAVTPLPSADGQFWDIQDTSPWAQDSGGIATGGRANPFNGFGYLKLQVGTRRAPRQPWPTSTCTGFGLAHDGAERFDSITPVLHDGIVVSRAIYAPKDTSYLRYFDSFTNSEHRAARRARWPGAARPARSTTADEWRWRSPRAATARIDPADPFVTVMQNARGVARPDAGAVGTRALGARAGRTGAAAS